MEEHKKNIKQQNIRLTFENIDKIHPHKMMMYLFIFGTSMVFLFMILAYTVSDARVIGYEMPKAFIISAMIMLISSFMVSKIIPAFKDEKIFKVRNTLTITLSLALLFSLFQFIGWQQLKDSEIFKSSEAVYLYVISGLHLGIFVLAVSFLSVILIESMKVAKDPVKVLIKVTNPYEIVRLEMLNVFWQFITVLWIALFFYFLYRF